MRLLEEGPHLHGIVSPKVRGLSEVVDEEAVALLRGDPTTLVCGCRRYPSCSRVAMSLRTVAEDTCTPEDRTTSADPTG